MAYYILSPFTAIILLFPRDMIPEAVSIVVALKIVLSGLTCMFFIDRYFNKLKNNEKIFLSLLYAFSSYNIVMYVITGWIDIVYLFPLLMVGLKELLDLKDKKLYTLVLAMSFIFNYYLSLILLIFIVLAAGIYLYIYNKKEMKKAIFTLGVCTLIALLLSSVIVIPSVLQTLSSQRAGINLRALLNSSKGPLADKLSLLFTSAPLIAFTILLLINYKKHKKFSSFIFSLIIIMGLPILIEPINKLWHFGSYVCFPYRYGFTMIFLLVTAAAYYLEKVDNKFKINKQKVLSIGGIVLALGLMVLGFIKRKSIRYLIYKLSFTKNKFTFAILLGLFIVSIITYILLEIKKSKKNRIAIYSLAALTVVFYSFMYFGFYDYDPVLKENYISLNQMTELKEEAGVYSFKRVKRDLISNLGMVTGLRSFSNFTSLTAADSFMTFQRLGYDSFWMDTESVGGNLFIDTILGNKYIVSVDEYNSPYYDLYKEYDYVKIYKYNKEMPVGYTLEKTDNLEHVLDNIKNCFESSNIIYNYITGKEDNIIDTIDLPYNDTVIEKEIDVKNKQEVYLEIFTEFDSNKKARTYEAFKIYVNDKLIEKKFPHVKRNGTLDLGLFENEKVKIRIEVLSKKVIPRNITVGLLDLAKYDEFISGNYGKFEIDFDNNKIVIGSYLNEDKTVFIPIPNIGYDVDDVKLTKAFGAFLGIPLKAGVNVTELSFMPKGIIVGLVFSVIGLILLLVLDKIKIFDIKGINNCAYYVFMTAYYAILSIYVIGTVAFLVTFIHKI